MTVADWVAVVVAGVAQLTSLYAIYRQRASAKPTEASSSFGKSVSIRGQSSGVPRFAR
jgi:hypothetical protein